jgi:hypothetical protein
MTEGRNDEARLEVYGICLWRSLSRGERGSLAFPDALRDGPRDRNLTGDGVGEPLSIWRSPSGPA